MNSLPLSLSLTDPAPAVVNQPSLSYYHATSVAAAVSWIVTTENSPLRFRAEGKVFKDKQQET